MSTTLEKLKSSRRYKIAISVILFSVVFFIGVTFFKTPDKEITFLVIGQVSGIASTVLAFYFSANDDKKEDEPEITK